ncbi:hypothetical protein, partial [Sphaerospermopsis reniformis]|uniref:hypothetical protein n=1 Tax=Sphaerospermopsis reniformis TaxID=531300 RepID=UPI001F42CD0A
DGLRDMYVKCTIALDLLADGLQIKLTRLLSLILHRSPSHVTTSAMRHTPSPNPPPPVPSPQSPVPSPQSPVPSHQSPVTSLLSLNRS